MCLRFIIYIYCNPVFHLALCRLVYAVRERRMKWQLWTLMNKTWLLIPGCWADTQIEPLSSVCHKFSGEVWQRSYNVEEISISGDNPSNFPAKLAKFQTLYILLIFLTFNLLLSILSSPFFAKKKICAVVSLVSKWNRILTPAVKHRLVS